MCFLLQHWLTNSPVETQIHERKLFPFGLLDWKQKRYPLLHHTHCEPTSSTLELLRGEVWYGFKRREPLTSVRGEVESPERTSLSIGMGVFPLRTRLHTIVQTRQHSKCNWYTITIHGFSIRIIFSQYVVIKTFCIFTYPKSFPYEVTYTQGPRVDIFLKVRA